MAGEMEKWPIITGRQPLFAALYISEQLDDVVSRSLHILFLPSSVTFVSESITFRLKRQNSSPGNWKKND